MTDFSPIPNQEPLLGSRDVATMLGMSREQVWRLWTSGRLPGYRFDRHVRFSPQDLERFMAEHYRPGPARGVAAKQALSRGRGRALPDDHEGYRRI